MTLLLTLSMLAQAQVTGGESPELNAQSWRPSVDSQSFLWMTDSALMRDRQFSGRALLAYSSPSLVYQDDNGDDVVLMGHLAELDLTGAYTIGPGRFGLVAPIYLLGTSDPGNQTGIGDLVLDGKVRVLDREESPVGVHLSARTTMPTASVNLPLGSNGVLYELEGGADQEFGNTLLAVNLGHRGQPRVDLENGRWDDQLYTRLGAAQSVAERSGVGAEWITQLSYNTIDQAAILPSELLFEGWHGLRESDLVLRGGVGVGLGSAVGIPATRAILTLAYEPAGEPDTDGDGLVDSVDRCPNEPEDFDERMDDDGCPDVGSVTFVFVDPDGKPVNGVSWTVGDRSGAGDETLQIEGPGHTVEATAEGYKAASVAFDAPEDGQRAVSVELGFLIGRLVVDAKGPDGEPLEDVTWILTDQAARTEGGGGREVKAGAYTYRVDAPGYRSVDGEVTIAADAEEVVKVTLQPARAEVTADRIDIRESVYFETAKAVIKQESFGLLDEVADILRLHPELTKIKVEGHTDSQGGDKYNLELSEKRAESVKTYLIEAGVAPGRLESEGFGETRPLVPERNASDRARNRRVDFMVAERSDGPVEETQAPAKE